MLYFVGYTDAHLTHYVRQADHQVDRQAGHQADRQSGHQADRQFDYQADYRDSRGNVDPRQCPDTPTRTARATS